MVNFYNNYVTCNNTATTQNVAGKVLLGPTSNDNADLLVF